MALEEKYMWAIVDGVKEKVGNFRVEPPGLFQGRGEHPKMGMLKRRIQPKYITINIRKIPQYENAQFLVKGGEKQSIYMGSILERSHKPQRVQICFPRGY